MTARFSTVEIKRAIKAAQACGLDVQEIDVDENGFKVIVHVNNGENENKSLDKQPEGYL